MQSTQFELDTFRDYYDQGMEALKKKEYSKAQRNILHAAETLVKLAKKSTGELKEKRLARADELVELANSIEAQKQVKRQSSNLSTAKNDFDKYCGGQNNQNQSNLKSSNDDSLTKFEPSKSEKITLDDVAGLEDVKQEIRRAIIDPQKYPELYSRYNVKKGAGILLYGVPGNGKTMIAKAIANEVNAPFYSVKCSDICSKWFGEAEQNIRNLFETVRKNKNAIIFFDEFEAIGAKRDTHSTVMKRIVPELLAQIEGFDKSDTNLILIAASNRPWDIDSAFKRSGRFTTSIHVPLPNEAARKKIIESNLKNIDLADDVDIDRMVDLTDGFNGGDVKHFCEYLKMCAIDRCKENGTQFEPINADDVETTGANVKSTVSKEDIKKIYEYEQSLK